MLRLTLPSPSPQSLHTVLLGASKPPPAPSKTIEQQIVDWRTFHEARFKAEVARLTGATEDVVHAYLSPPELGHVPEGVTDGILVSIAVQVPPVDSDGDDPAQNSLAALAPLPLDAAAAVAAFGAGGRYRHDGNPNPSFAHSSYTHICPLTGPSINLLIRCLSATTANSTMSLPKVISFEASETDEVRTWESAMVDASGRKMGEVATSRAEGPDYEAGKAIRRLWSTIEWPAVAKVKVEEVAAAEAPPVRKLPSKWLIATLGAKAVAKITKLGQQLKAAQERPALLHTQAQHV